MTRHIRSRKYINDVTIIAPPPLCHPHCATPIGRSVLAPVLTCFAISACSLAPSSLYTSYLVPTRNANALLEGRTRGARGGRRCPVSIGLNEIKQNQIGQSMHDMQHDMWHQVVVVGKLNERCEETGGRMREPSVGRSSEGPTPQLHLPHTCRTHLVEPTNLAVPFFDTHQRGPSRQVKHEQDCHCIIADQWQHVQKLSLPCSVVRCTRVAETATARMPQ